MALGGQASRRRSRSFVGWLVDGAGVTSLAIEYALNSSGLPVDVISSPEVVGGVVTGNVTGVLSFLAATYSLPAWSVDAVVALSGAARPTRAAWARC